MFGHYGSTAVFLAEYLDGTVQVPDIGLPISTCEAIDTLRSVRDTQMLSRQLLTRIPQHLW